MAAALANSSLFYVEDVLSRRDYSVIPHAETRVAYCMLTGVAAHEKHVFAQSVARPADSQFFSVVLSEALAGEITAQKRAALRDIRERDELRRRATHATLRVANECGYDGIGWQARVTPWSIMERWLQHDGGYAFFLRRARQAGPDAAEHLYKVTLKKA